MLVFFCYDREMCYCAKLKSNRYFEESEDWNEKILNEGPYIHTINEFLREHGVSEDEVNKVMLIHDYDTYVPNTTKWVKE